MPRSCSLKCDPRPGALRRDGFPVGLQGGSARARLHTVMGMRLLGGYAAALPVPPAAAQHDMLMR
eukprot:7907097-Heterocapsa_arctica.AAC.1